MSVPPLYFYREFSVPRKLHRYGPEYHQQHRQQYIPHREGCVRSKSDRYAKTDHNNGTDQAGFEYFSYTEEGKLHPVHRKVPCKSRYTYGLFCQRLRKSCIFRSISEYSHCEEQEAVNTNHLFVGFPGIPGYDQQQERYGC